MGPTGYDPSRVGVQTMVVQAPQMQVYSSPYQAVASDFPTIGQPAQPRVVQWGAPQGGVMMAPPMVSAAPPSGSIVLTQPREGVQFDQSHPRHQFARVPTVMQNTGVVQAIDWSSGGMPTQVQSAIISSGGGRAHLSPVATVAQAQAVPMNVMKAQYAQPNYAPTRVVSHAPPPVRLQQPRR